MPPLSIKGYICRLFEGASAILSVKIWVAREMIGSKRWKHWFYLVFDTQYNVKLYLIHLTKLKI